MRISYNKLWKMLIDKNMKKSDLKDIPLVLHPLHGGRGLLQEQQRKIRFYKVFNRR